MGGLSFQRRHARAALAALSFVIAAATLAACNLTSVDERPQDVIDKVRSLDLFPAFLRPSEETAGKNRGLHSRESEREAIEMVATPTAAAVTPDDGTGFELSFENAPIASVAKVMLGDILGAGYMIDPRVQGTITLSSGRPVPKSEILYVLENALRINNVALIHDRAGYRLIPVVDAVGNGNLDRAGGSRLDRTAADRSVQPGFGLTAVPLQYVSAQTLIKLLDSFATKPASVRADPGRNILLVQGTGPERQFAVETILSFDTDWMRGQSVGVYPVRNSTPEPIIAELEKIMDSGEGGISQSMVKLQPVSRMNAILVVTKKPELLRTVSVWISRLDASEMSAMGVKVYRLRYGNARQVARLLNEMFVSGPGGTAAEATTAPGSEATTTLSSDRTTMGGVSTSGGFSTSRPALSNAPQSPTAGIDQSAQRNVNINLPAAETTTPAPARAAGGATALLPNVRITADTVNNTLLIYANAESYRIIERTLHQIDRPQLQVSIETTVAEVTLNDNLNYGVQFFLQSSDLKLGGDNGSIINSVGGALLGQQFPGFNLLLGAAANPRYILDALHNLTDVKVLSNPSVVVLDNQVATLQVGDQIPVTTGTATVLNSANQVVSTIDYRNTGIILRVVPRINVNGNVVLDVEQEISNVPATTPPGSLTPTISQRRVKSSIAVASGQTVLLAGLITETRGRQRQGVPIVDQIPLIGEAFSHSSRSATRTELIIFIRPIIIRDSVDAHYVAEELRSKISGQRSVLVAPGATPPTVVVPPVAGPAAVVPPPPPGTLPALR